MKIFRCPAFPFGGHLQKLVGKKLVKRYISCAPIVNYFLADGTAFVTAGFLAVPITEVFEGYIAEADDFNQPDSEAPASAILLSQYDRIDAAVAHQKSNPED